MQIVIEIDEEKYKWLKENNPKADKISIVGTIVHGAPLPKGHGRLIDADAFKKKVCTYQQTGCGDCKYSLCCTEDMPTIIEADKAESEDKT